MSTCVRAAFVTRAATSGPDRRDAVRGRQGVVDRDRVPDHVRSSGRDSTAVAAALRISPDGRRRARRRRRPTPTSTADDAIGFTFTPVDRARPAARSTGVPRRRSSMSTAPTSARSLPLDAEDRRRAARRPLPAGRRARSRSTARRRAVGPVQRADEPRHDPRRVHRDGQRQARRRHVPLRRGRARSSSSSPASALPCRGEGRRSRSPRPRPRPQGVPLGEARRGHVTTIAKPKPPPGRRRRPPTGGSSGGAGGGSRRRRCGRRRLVGRRRDVLPAADELHADRRLGHLDRALQQPRRAERRPAQARRRDLVEGLAAVRQEARGRTTCAATSSAATPAIGCGAAGYTSYRWAREPRLPVRQPVLGGPRLAPLLPEREVVQRRPLREPDERAYDRVGIGVWVSGGRVRARHRLLPPALASGPDRRAPRVPGRTGTIGPETPRRPSARRSVRDPQRRHPHRQRAAAARRPVRDARRRPTSASSARTSGCSTARSRSSSTTRTRSSSSRTSTSGSSRSSPGPRPGCRSSRSTSPRPTRRTRPSRGRAEADLELDEDFLRADPRRLIGRPPVARCRGTFRVIIELERRRGRATLAP